MIPDTSCTAFPTVSAGKAEGDRNSKRSLYTRLEGMHLCLLAPDPELIPRNFANVLEDTHLHTTLLDSVQQLRGKVYVADGAIPTASLDEQGRHYVASDRDCWHAVMRDGYGNIRAAIRMAIHFHHKGKVGLDDLQANQLVRRMHPSVGHRFGAALMEFIGDAQTAPCFFETGGWVIDDGARKQTVAPVTVASVYALSRAVGGARGVGSATTRHESATILKRFGGFEIPCGKAETLAPFFDPSYGCDMQILGFASDRVSAVFEPTVRDIMHAFDAMPVFTTSGKASSYEAEKTPCL